MQRKFVGNLLFLLFLNLLIKPFWILGIDVAVQNRVGAEDYGFYNSIFGFSILLNIILDFGITNYNNRNIAQHNHMLKRYFSGIFNVKLILGLVYFVVTLLFGFVIGYGEKAIKLLFILAINQFLASMILYLRSNISGLHLFKLEGVLSILDRSLMILICGALIWGGFTAQAFQIEWFVYAQLLSYSLTALVAFLVVLAKAKFFKIKFDWIVFRLIIKESLPFALLVLLMSFYYRLDAVMIERLLPDGRYQTGVYAQAYRLLEGFNMFGYLFAGLLLPIFSRMIKEKQAVSGLVRTAFNLIFIPACAVATVSLIHPEAIMDLLYWENVKESARVYEVLMLSFVAIALTYIYGTLLTANGNLRALNKISLVGLLINFGLNWTLIPNYGAFGAAVATLITQFVIVLLQIMSVKKEFQIPYSSPFIIKSSLLAVLGLGFAALSRAWFDSFILHIFIVFVVFGALTFLLGLIRISDLRQIIKQKS
jgi:O-antigen/teichoic acid export membrane protein